MAELSDIDYPMTNFDIKAIYPNLPVIKYPELANYRDIHHLTNNPYGGAIILVVHTPAGGGEGVSGHWFMVWMNKKDNDVYLFDSYGKYPDRHIVELGHDRVNFDEDNNGFNVTLYYVILNRGEPVVTGIFLERIR